VAIDINVNHWKLILKWKRGEMADHRFPNSVRLRRQLEFDRVHGGDVFAADNILVIKGVRNELSVSRLGLSISRRVGNAVVRNRWKRRIREAFRKQQSALPSGIDFVVRPKKGAVCDYAAIERSIPRLLQRIEKNLSRL
jgi:ribonuclease P protein component